MNPEENPTTQEIIEEAAALLGPVAQLIASMDQKIKKAKAETDEHKVIIKKHYDLGAQAFNESFARSETSEAYNVLIGGLKQSAETIPSIIIEMTDMSQEAIVWTVGLAYALSKGPSEGVTISEAFYRSQGEGQDLRIADDMERYTLGLNYTHMLRKRASAIIEALLDIFSR
jgi:hypothetical protein